MRLKKYHLTPDQVSRLKEGIKTALAIPFIDGVEDFIWEAVFSHAKGVPLVDPMHAIRSKLLYDVVDPATKRGWSAKSLQWSFPKRGQFELVIQRADIFKKHAELGFDELDRESDPALLGAALLEHWGRKIIGDARTQGVEDRRVCILLKSADSSRFAYFEEEIALYQNHELEWKWSSPKKVGLIGIRKADEFPVYRWYPNQKQFFERFQTDEETLEFALDIKRQSIQSLIDLFRDQV